MRDLEIGIICYSVISCCFSLFVIGTILFFPAMKNGNFMPIILYMSIADLGMNIASSFGFPSDGTLLCWAQGLLQNYFALSSWFWTTLLAYRVYSFVRFGKCRITKTQMFIIAWGLPVLLTVAPMTTINYGASESNSQWCVFTQRGNNPAWLLPFWGYSTFYCWLFLCILLMFVWQVVISYQFRHSTMKAVISRTYDKVYLYPVAMVVCWILNYYCDEIYINSNQLLNALSMIFGISNGMLAALIFIFKSEEGRRRWTAYLFTKKASTFDEAVEPTIRLDFENDTDNSRIDIEGNAMEDYSTNGSSTRYTHDLTLSSITMSDLSGENPLH